MYNKEENNLEGETIGDVKRHTFTYIEGGLSNSAAEKLLHKLIRNKWIIVVNYNDLKVSKFTAPR